MDDVESTRMLDRVGASDGAGVGGAGVQTGTDGGLQGGGQFQVVVAVLAGGGIDKKLGIFTFSASSLTSRVPRLDGLSTRKRLSKFSQSVDM